MPSTLGALSANEIASDPLSFDHTFPSFFESIMVSVQDWNDAENAMMPRDISNFIPEQYTWLGMDDMFGFDFTTAIDQVMPMQPTNMGAADNFVDDTGA